MEALGALSAREYVEAQIQKHVAEFLSLKLQLVNMKTSSSITIKSRAKGLYESQIILEGKLKESLRQLELMKETGIQYTIIIQLTAFGYELARHINAVKKLRREAQGITTTDDINWKTWGIPVAILLSGVLAFMGMRSRKR